MLVERIVAGDSGEEMGSNGTNGVPQERELEIGKGAEKIKIATGLSTFPVSLLAPFATLTTLDLSGNTHLSTLPKEISRLHVLKIAFFSNCSFHTFPIELAKCRSLEMVAFKSNAMHTIPEHAFPRKLRWLILTNNALTSLPQSIGSCEALQKCMLAGNRLQALPEGMARCRKLGLLRLSSNELGEVPSWVFGMPELSFLSFAGNPCSVQLQETEGRGLEEIPWREVEIAALLGEGASGVISKARWGGRDVAVKVFKGAVTSDGSPIDEMAATIAAGSHANLINPLGRLSSSGDYTSKQGLVLQLIPPSYTNLGLPPTLDSCTRDSFPPGTTLSLRTVVGILRGIASAAAHLHGRGISHGDLYAHNILLDTTTGHALLGDFGAATVYGGAGSTHDVALERLEVLGFGHLVEDLLGLLVVECDGG
ncbi:Leucine-rich repeat-containing protein, partial [Lachnellula suecica]